MSKTVWIDLENSPHVPFFLPWIAWLRDAGHEVLLTARDLSQTHELLRLHGLAFEGVGGHGGGSKLLKAGRTLGRAQALVRRLHRRRVDLALGHGSRAQVVAARWLRVPSITFLDYEYVSLRIFGLLCSQVFFPQAVPAEVLLARGIPRRKLVFYPGVKEQVYLDPDLDRPHPVSPPLILVRLPARRAHYHTEKSERLYRLLIERLAAEATDARVLFLPRYGEDLDELRELVSRYSHFALPAAPEPARDLLLRASLVISGGGTMVREAAVLGIPAVSFFGGPLGGVDRLLESMGRLGLMHSEAQVAELSRWMSWRADRAARRPPEGPEGGAPAGDPPAAASSGAPAGSASPVGDALPPAEAVRRALWEKLSESL